MRVIFNHKRYHGTKRPVAIALGTFDGMHRGHQKLMSQLHKINLLYGCDTMMYTFLEHPLSKLNPNEAPSQIMSIHEKILFLKKCGIDWLILNPFDTDFSQTSPKSFIEDLLLKHYDVKAIVVGYNFKFGFQGKGDVNFLKQMSRKHGFKLVVVPPVSVNGNIVSSSLIRRCIENGQVKEANEYLGRPYAICGQVIHGFGRGKSLGFPTANLSFNHKKIIPKYGVYITKTYIGKKAYWGVTNIGQNPTFQTGGLYLETHLIDYEGDLYGKRMKIEFLFRLREEKTFHRIEDLKNQVYKDINYVKNFIYKYKRI